MAVKVQLIDHTKQWLLTFSPYCYGNFYTFCEKCNLLSFCSEVAESKGNNAELAHNSL